VNAKWRHCLDFFILFLPVLFYPCPPIDSIITLMSLWRITEKIIKTTVVLITYARI